MTAPSDLEALLARVEGATGGDREVDAAICKAVDTKRWEQARNWAAMPCGAPEETIERDAARYAFAYTASLDAALALVERVLPGWRVSLLQRPPQWEAVVARNFSGRSDQGPHEVRSARSSTAPLALLAALLKALSAQSASPAGGSGREGE